MGLPSTAQAPDICHFTDVPSVTYPNNAVLLQPMGQWAHTDEFAVLSGERLYWPEVKIVITVYLRVIFSL